MKKYLFSFIIILWFVSCGNKQHKQYNIELLRMDSLFISDTSDISYSDYKNRYGSFWDIYCQNIIFLPEVGFQDSLSLFQKEDDFQRPHKELRATFADFSKYEQQFGEAFYVYNHEFPEKIVPSIITFFGGFNYIAVATDSSLAVGLEMFLGQDSEYYSKLTHKFPTYMHQRFQADYMVPLAIDGWLESEFQIGPNDFLSQMVHYGKIKYALKKCLVQTPDHIIMGFTESQLEWCKLSEFSIWKFLIEEGLIYSRDQFLINKYIKPAPYSRGMPQESPGQAAVWIGWNIVHEFMKKYPDMSLQQLFEIKDAQYILNKSKYKPR